MLFLQEKHLQLTCKIFKKIAQKFFFAKTMWGNLFNYLFEILDLKNSIPLFVAAGVGAIVKHNWPGQMSISTKLVETTEETIRRVCKEEMVDPNLALKVAQCESGLKPYAINKNTDGSTDHGIFQINDKYHPEVTLEQALDVDYATRFFCRAFKAGHLAWWSASKKCWGA